MVKGKYQVSAPKTRAEPSTADQLVDCYTRAMLRGRSSQCRNLQTRRSATVATLALIGIGAASWYAVGRTRLVSQTDTTVLRFYIPGEQSVGGPVTAHLNSPATANLGNELRTAWPARPGRERDLIVDLVAAPTEIGARSLQEVELRFAYGVKTRGLAKQGQTPHIKGTEAEDAVLFIVEQVAADRTTVLFSNQLSGSTIAETFDHWHEGSITLPIAAIGQAPLSSRIRFRSEVSGHSEASRQAYWGDVHLAGVNSASPRSILLISIDTLRADRFSLLGRRERKTTPQIDAWARRHAAVFSDAVAAAPWTLPSHASIFSGLGALHHGINRESNENHIRFAGESRAFPYLAEILRAGGFRTGAAVGGGLLAPQFGFAAGFDVYRWSTGAQSNQREIDQGVRSTLDWLRAHRHESTFFFLHTYRVHSPYQRDSPEFAALTTGADVGKDLRPLDIDFLPPLAEKGHRNDRGRPVVVDSARSTHIPIADLRALDDAYDAGVVAADTAIGRLLKIIERERLDRRLTIVITSDHGEALGESGRYGHHDLHEATLRVPLLLAVPGGQPRLISTQVRHVDILPTILEAAELAAPPGLDGVSLLPFASGRTVDVPELAWSYAGAWNQGLSVRLGGRFKLLLDDTAWWASPRPRILGHDLAADPAESSGLILDPPAPNTATEATLGPEFDRLRALAEETLVQATGLWLQLSNPSTLPIEIRLASSGILPDGLKTVPTEGLEVRWVKMGLASVTLAPGKSAQLRITRPFHHRLRLSLGRGLVGGTSYTFTVEELAKEPVLVRGPMGWARVERPLEPGETGVAFEWKGPIRRSVEAPPAAKDSATEKQLRALGYVS